MKKKHIYIIISVLFLFILFLPLKWESYPDGTKVYSAIFAKYISWHQSFSSGYAVEEAYTTRIYFFPENQKGFDTLREEFFASRNN